MYNAHSVVSASSTFQQQQQHYGRGANLIVNYIPVEVTSEEFYQNFAEFGPIQSCKIVADRETGLSKGFGFVQYFDPGHAAAAIEALDGVAMYNKRLKVGYARAGSTPGVNASRGVNVAGKPIVMRLPPPPFILGHEMHSDQQQVSLAPVQYYFPTTMVQVVAPQIPQPQLPQMGVCTQQQHSGATEEQLFATPNNFPSGMAPGSLCINRAQHCQRQQVPQ